MDDSASALENSRSFRDFPVPVAALYYQLGPILKNLAKMNSSVVGEIYPLEAWIQFPGEFQLYVEYFFRGGPKTAVDQGLRDTKILSQCGSFTRSFDPV